jgi:2-amino-4-hydroxy-6-hydroxymethyldihydropteridine diphosphokinase
MAEVYVGLGTNLGDKEFNLRRALEHLREGGCRIAAFSSIYRTEPVGYADQDWFLNAAARLETTLEPRDLLGLLRSIEKALGRIHRVRNGPRVIDLDILFYDDRIQNESTLIIPHPRLHERMFVLAPLCDLAPEFVHPVLRKSVNDLKEALKNPEGVAIYLPPLPLDLQP